MTLQEAPVPNWNTLGFIRVPHPAISIFRTRLPNSALRLPSRVIFNSCRLSKLRKNFVRSVKLLLTRVALGGLPQFKRQAATGEESTMMVSVFVGTSLDGFIARPNGDFDFLPAGGGEPHGYNEFMASVDAIVIGRNTFEKVLTLGPWFYGKKRVVVLSSRPVDL